MERGIITRSQMSAFEDTAACLGMGWAGGGWRGPQRPRWAPAGGGGACRPHAALGVQVLEAAATPTQAPGVISQEGEQAQMCGGEF